MDVKSAYLNVPLDYEIYIDPPKRIEDQNGNYDWKFKKSLYGLKQSSRTWNKTFHAYQITQHFSNHLYVYSKCQQSDIHNLLWVDDISIASKTRADLMKIKAKLNSRFKMSDLGKLSCFLGIQFECKNSTIEMKQSTYFENMLSKFGMVGLQTMLKSM